MTSLIASNLLLPQFDVSCPLYQDSDQPAEFLVRSEGIQFVENKISWVECYKFDKIGPQELHSMDCAESKELTHKWMDAS